ncbi:hypothetical protein ACFW1A_20540 [Kitasatospora sp. NPDC058965]|uniref:hypothetical protein n=1 Tax=Kitasatospora sp. NPDC058965 TaxID=3346682 RepID=UPI0036745918
MTTASARPFEAPIPAARPYPLAATRPAAACYLRCFPYDPWEMRDLAAALFTFARRWGYWEPTVFLDNGVASSSARPSLDALVAAVTARQYRVVFVPGLWVFAIQDDAALAARARLLDAGCEVLELPPGS